jgi:hypothetical protein
MDLTDAQREIQRDLLRLLRPDAAGLRLDEAAKLIRALGRAEGFALYLVRCNTLMQRFETADYVEARLDRPVARVALSDVDQGPARPAIDALLEHRLADAPPDAVVFMYGLEHLLPSTDEAVTQRTLTELNWRRDAYARLGRPLVLWLPAYAIRFLARNAPDFYDWHSGLYEFDTPEALRLPMVDAMMEVLNEEDHAELRPLGRWKREARLRELKDECGGDTMEEKLKLANVCSLLGNALLEAGHPDKAAEEFDACTEALQHAKPLMHSSEALQIVESTIEKLRDLARTMGIASASEDIGDAKASTSSDLPAVPDAAESK